MNKCGEEEYSEIPGLNFFARIFSESSFVYWLVDLIPSFGKRHGVERRIFNCNGDQRGREM